MACAISTAFLLHSSSSGWKPCLCAASSNIAIAIPKNAIFHHVRCIPQLGLTPFCKWNGLKHLGISMPLHSVKIGKRRFKDKGVSASLFGVGAPEALVIGVVALLVFGPKGLAEVARNLGKTLRAFQPTIRELQEVSREFKNTLEREIGLDEPDYQGPKSSSSNTSKPVAEDTTEYTGPDIASNGIPSENVEGTDEQYVGITGEKLRGVLAQLQKEQAEEAERALIESESQTPSVDSPDSPLESSSETVPAPAPKASDPQEFTSAVSSSSPPPPPIPEPES